MAPRQQQSSMSTSSDERSSSETEPILEKRTGPQNLTALRSDLEAETSTARDGHDLFNLVALLPTIVFTLANWDYSKFGLGPAAAWTDYYFMHLFVSILGYFAVDIAWLFIVPHCVKAPKVLILHHVLAAVYVIAPFLWPDYRWYMGALLSSEINTWFLIARRVVLKRKMDPWLINITTSLFYLTWVALRIVVFPAVLIRFLFMAYDAITESGTFMHPQLIFLPLQFLLVGLNFKWSVDLFAPHVKRWTGKSS